MAISVQPDDPGLSLARALINTSNLPLLLFDGGLKVVSASLSNAPYGVAGDWRWSFAKVPAGPSLAAAPAALEQSVAHPSIDPKADKTDRALLKRVTRYVNARVQQRTDAQIYGQDELWRRSGVGIAAMGDCEDIAIEKRAELTEAGFPGDRLSFAIVYSQQAGLHTVLVARMADGDMVLDSRNGFLMPWYKAAYSWISVQSMVDPKVWYALDQRTRQG